MRSSLMPGSLLVLTSLFLTPFFFAACGSDDGGVTTPASGVAAGTSGSAGSPAGGGASGAGAGAGAGNSGAAGAPTACKTNTDCAVPTTTPAGCAEGVCESGVCKVKARDADGDGQRTKVCAVADGSAIELGTDCNDADATVFPGAWDGPAAGGKPDRCSDGVDQDCSGVDGDSTGPLGESCTCTPGDVQECDQDAGGKPITFPGGSPIGACARGKRTCVIDGITKAAVFTACIGAQGPTKEICNGDIDDDCDGKADMRDDDPPLNTATWSYDADGDGFVKDASYRTEWCGDERPTLCPADFPPDGAGQPTCDTTKWKLANLASGDCDDQNDSIRVGGAEVCNGDGKDYNCNGKTNVPGVGTECGCREGDQVACAPSDKNFPDSATVPSDKYPLPSTVDLRSGGLVGECRWGTKECINGQWTSCHDGVGAQASENCSKKDQKDYNCNGIPNRTADDQPTSDCQCTTGNTRACGVCGQGLETCADGAWGTCTGDDKQVMFCADADGDGACTAVCGLECPSADHTGKREKSTCSGGGANLDCADNNAAAAPGKTELCSEVDEDCDGDAYGNYTDPGTACDNQKFGSCFKTGGVTCATTSSNGCDAGNWADAPSASYSDVMLHGSFDRNCDGVRRRTKIGFQPRESVPAPAGKSCVKGDTAYWGSVCAAHTQDPQGEIFFLHVVCESDLASPADDGEAYLKYSDFGGTRIPKCGRPFVLLTCNMKANYQVLAAGGDAYNMQCN
jgi:hypothetical protein